LIKKKGKYIVIWMTDEKVQEKRADGISAFLIKLAKDKEKEQSKR